MMAEKIKSHMRPSMGVLDLHLFFVYEDSNGKKYYSEGTLNFPTIEPDLPWNNLVTDDGEFIPNTEKYLDYTGSLDKPIHPIAEGEDLRELWDKIKDVMQQIEDAGTKYGYKSNNSNATHNTTLKELGYPPVPGTEDHPLPGWDDELPLEPPIDGFDPDDVLPGLSEWLNDLLGEWTAAFGMISPLVLDLDGDGIELIALSDSTAYFDLDADDFAERTGWVGPDDGILALDANGNGVIDDITEVFGNATTDGFTELAALDSNSDGIMDASDSQFSDLLVWQDTNQNGYSSPDELKTLSDLGITSISLASTSTETFVEGNLISDISTYTMADGSTGQIVDVWFDNDQTDTYYNGDVELDTATLYLPMLRGYGEVANLTVAMSIDNLLATMVGDLSSSDLDQGHTFNSQITAILNRWAGIEDVVAGSRGKRVDAQHLAFLEAYFGTPFVGYAGPNPFTRAGAALEEIYEDLFNELSARLLVQGPLRDIFPDLGYDLSSDTFEGTVDYATAVDTIEQSAPTDALELANYWDALVSTLDTLGGYAAPPSDYDQRLTDALAATGSAYTLQGIREGQVDLTGSGNEYLTGGAAADSYSLDTGIGADRVLDDDPGASALDFVAVGAGLTPADIAVSRGGANGDDLTLKIAATGDQLTLLKQFESARYGVEEVRFDAGSGGTVWTPEDLVDLLLASTAGDDELYGDGRDTSLDGGAGNDYLEGRGGSDTYSSPRSSARARITAWW